MTAEAPDQPPRSLYLHLPFCARRCPYCDFAIVVGDELLQDRYLDALLAELARMSASGAAPLPLQTLYLGGGTPSLLGPSRLGRLLAAVEAGFGLETGCEVTMEANPEEVTPAAAAAWADLGVTRVSLGVQSLDDDTLLWLGRGHDSRTAESAVATLRESAIPALSCDLIYAIPVQPTATFARGLDRLLSHGPDHISCYELTVEPGTQLQRWVAGGAVPAPDEEDFLAQGKLARDALARAGLHRYEVSNYSRPGSESRHNLNYWTGAPYLAAGCGAHGFLGRSAAAALGIEGAGERVRYWHLRAAATYVRSVAAGEMGLRGREWLTGSELALERLALGLRLTCGVELSTPGQLEAGRRLAVQGLLLLEGRRVQATPEGMDVLDRLTLELAAA
ncbi:MAG: radical SAM family heme chaperone HemW [Candidatus Dormiibacterota bacterium]